VAEIAGGWLVWQTIRLHKAWYLAVAGAVVLIAYGFIPCAQPMDNFGRVRVLLMLTNAGPCLPVLFVGSAAALRLPYAAKCCVAAPVAVVVHMHTRV
jgi:hypothetical protein